MGTQFEQVKGGKNTLTKCLEAIKTAYDSSELWVDSFIKSSTKLGYISKGTTVLLHYWQSIKQTNVNWEYWLSSKNVYEIKFEYQDYTGKAIRIYEIAGRSKVSRDKTTGFSDEIVEKLENLSIDEFTRCLEDILMPHLGTDDTELKIIETI